ncbi:hypothetical protein P5673_014739 [Acropora cervicornis]|uniref:Uncharacterized protein n=1 Tax=Acropora cervicornis TaxID=6130 RepID=A0AAD9QIK0_ACRCE|nr:hypothetical protein P5673_014739 [Acropora cervicornis]
MVFPIIFAAVSIGFVMLVCVGAAFAWMWYDDNEEAALEEIVIEKDNDQSAESSKQTKPPSAQIAAEEITNKDHGTWTLAESSSKDSKTEKSCNSIEIPETNSPDSSKTSASLSDELTENECCDRFSSLTAPSSPPSDLGSHNAIVIELQRSDSTSTASDRSTTAISSSPKKSSTSDVSSSSGGELTGTAFSTTDNSADSSTQSCKVPVAPVDEIVITIEDDYDNGKANQSNESVTKRDRRINGSENSGKEEQTITAPSEIVAENKSSISQEVNGDHFRPCKACSDGEEGGDDMVGKTVRKPLLKEHDVSFFTANDEMRSGEDKPDEMKGGSEGFESTLKDHTESPKMQEKVTEKVETKQTNQCVGAIEDHEKASVMKALTDAIGEFVIIDNYVVPLSALDTCKKLFPNERTPPSHNKRDYYSCETQPIVDDFETYEPDIPDKNAVKGTPWEEVEFGIRGGSKASIEGGPFKNRTRTKEGDQLNAVYEVQRSPSIRNISSKISGFDHEKNPQVGCSCSFCENHWGKTHSPRYLKVPRKLLNSMAASSKSEE